MSKVNKKINAFIGFIIFAISFIIFFKTMPASISFWDCGEYITCSSILGVPHPPGNPFYIILGKLITMLPLGISDAQSVSLLSIIFCCFAVLFSYLIIVKLVSIWEKKSFFAYFAGIIGALFVAFSAEFWTNAIEAEVYGGLAFFLTLIVWLTLIWTEKSKDFDHQNILLLIIFLFFLGFCVHQTTLQIAPAILFIAVFQLIKFDTAFVKKALLFLGISFAIYGFFYLIGSEIGHGSISKYAFAIFVITILIYYLRNYVETKVWIFALVIVIIGISSHLILPIRASAHPFINEGDPSNWQRFMDYIFRKQYGPTSMFTRNVEASKLGYPLLPFSFLKQLLYQFTVQFTRYFSWQFFDSETISKAINLPKNLFHNLAQLFVVSLGVLGVMFQFKNSKRSFVYLFSLFFMASFAMVFVMNISDHEPRVRPYFFITAYMFWAYWMGIGALAIVKIISKKTKIVSILLAIILLILPVVNMASHYHKLDRSEELLSLEYGSNFLNGLDRNAIIFTNGDNDTFPLWCAQAVYDPNTEAYFLEDDSLKFQEITGKSVTNTKKISSRTKKLLHKAYKAKENLEGIRTDVSIANLSLLNTPWYIKQLRDYEGIDIRLSDSQIDALTPFRLSEDAIFRTGNIKIKLKKGKILYVKDQMVLQIIRDNFGKRPIYFAVTVGDNVGFNQYLQSEGMADRLVETKGRYQIDAARLNHNIENVFKYSSIFNENLYKDENMKRLLNNYGADYMRMSTVFYENKDYENAIKYMKISFKFIKDTTRYLSSLAQLYSKIQDYENAYNTLIPLIEEYPDDDQIVFMALNYLEKSNDIEKTLPLLENYLEKNPNEEFFLSHYLDICKENKKYKTGLTFIGKLLEREPENQNLIKYKSELQTLLETNN